MSATVWAGLLIVGVVGGVPLLSGTKHAGTRARLFFDHPNMAGNFFMIGLFLVLASGFPRRRPLRSACCAVLVVGDVPHRLERCTAVAGGGRRHRVFLHLKSHRGLAPAAAVATSLLLVLGAGAAYVVPPLVAAAEQSDAPFLRYTVGRSPESADKRGDALRRSDRAVRARRSAGHRPGRDEERTGQLLRRGGQGGPQRLPGDARRAGPARSTRCRRPDRRGVRADQWDHPSPADAAACRRGTRAGRPGRSLSGVRAHGPDPRGAALPMVLDAAGPGRRRPPARAAGSGGVTLGTHRIPRTGAQDDRRRDPVAATP